MDEHRFESFRDIISFAINREIEAARSYGELAAMATVPGMKKLLLELQADEENHRRILENLTEDQIKSIELSPVPDHRISDYIVEESLSSEMTFQDLLVFAAQKEKKAADLYGHLARMATTSEEKKIFEFLVGQEQAHKFKLESEYEKRILEEN